MIYEINWAMGGRVEIEADSPEHAHECVREHVPRGGEWLDIDVSPVPAVLPA